MTLETGKDRTGSDEFEQAPFFAGTEVGADASHVPLDLRRRFFKSEIKDTLAGLGARPGKVSRKR